MSDLGSKLVAAWIRTNAKVEVLIDMVEREYIDAAAVLAKDVRKDLNHFDTIFMDALDYGDGAPLMEEEIVDKIVDNEPVIEKGYIDAKTEEEEDEFDDTEGDDSDEAEFDEEEDGGELDKSDGD